MRSAALLALPTLFCLGACETVVHGLPLGCSGTTSCATENVTGGFEARVHIFRPYVPGPVQTLGEECRALVAQVAEAEAARRGMPNRHPAADDILVSSRRVPGGYASCTGLAWMPYT